MSSLRRQAAVPFSTRSVLRTMIILGIFVLAIDLYFLWPMDKVAIKRPLIPGIAQPNAVQRPGIEQPKQQPALPSTDTQNAVRPNDISQQPDPLVLAIMKEAGITDLSSATLQQLPTWKQVVDQYGGHPIMVGLDTCHTFRALVPAVRRMLGAAGMFSTGTNLVTVLLKQNCYIPERARQYGMNATKEELGMRWQVPWGKHTPAYFKWKHATEKAKNIVKEDLLPIVTIRNPWRWMQSMCKNPYTAKWPHWHTCPNLRDDDSWNNVTVKYGAATESYSSIVHLFNEWYEAYDQADYPRLLIRMEDLVFHTKETITKVCECAGGKIRRDRPFVYVVDSAKKDSPGHDTSTGFAEAWIKYSKPLQVQAGFTESDYEAALTVINQELMEKFGYRHPPSGY